MESKNLRISDSDSFNWHLTLDVSFMLSLVYSPDVKKQAHFVYDKRVLSDVNRFDRKGKVGNQ